MRVSVPKETASGERRVALVPEVVQRLGRADVEVILESGAGAEAHYPDADYEEAGATLGDGFSGQVVAKVGPPSADQPAACASPERAWQTRITLSRAGASSPYVS